MKYLVFCFALIAGCSNTSEKESLCQEYELRPITTREYFRYPLQGYVESIEYQFICVD